MSETEAPAEAAPRRRSPLIFLLPLILFGALAVVFLVGLFAGDASKVPSALIGKPAPPITLTALEGLQREGRPVPAFAMKDLAAGRATIVNVFASWCAPCRVEHPFLVAMAEAPPVKAGRVAVVGINYKDEAENARRFLGALGNPYSAVGVDASERAGRPREALHPRVQPHRHLRRWVSVKVSAAPSGSFLPNGLIAPDLLRQHQIFPRRLLLPQ